MYYTVAVKGKEHTSLSHLPCSPSHHNTRNIGRIFCKFEFHADLNYSTNEQQQQPPYGITKHTHTHTHAHTCKHTSTYFRSPPASRSCPSFAEPVENSHLAFRSLTLPHSCSIRSHIRLYAARMMRARRRSLPKGICCGNWNICVTKETTDLHWATFSAHAGPPALFPLRHYQVDDASSPSYGRADTPSRAPTSACNRMMHIHQFSHDDTLGTWMR